jgi:CheY-like chemotaxis protein
MDLHMPICDGFEATRTLRTRGYSGTIIALSAAGLPSDRQAARDAGVDAFLVKPVRMADLRATLEKFSQPTNE